jgi:antitoxin (DNA-binding transcriptional repressor) of toxin-antitoxin stability system
VIDRVQAGERLTVARDGTTVAELRALPARPGAATLALSRTSTVTCGRSPTTPTGRSRRTARFTSRNLVAPTLRP